MFDSWGVESTAVFTKDKIAAILARLEDADTYGTVLRAKGIVAGADGQWIHFDYVPGCPDVRNGGAEVIGRLCVIGADIRKDALTELFEV